MARFRKDRVIDLAVGPTLWSLYFLAVYITAAVRCAGAETADAGIGGIRIAIAALGLLTIGAIGVAARDAWRRWRAAGGGWPPHGDDSHQSRRQFMALSALLLCGLSVVATIYVALPAAFLADCR